VKTATHEIKIADRLYRRQNPALGKEYHKVCTCGGQAPWVATRDEAEKQECPHADQ
jgi:hypothetical protein